MQSAAEQGRRSPAKYGVVESSEDKLSKVRQAERGAAQHSLDKLGPAKQSKQKVAPTKARLSLLENQRINMISKLRTLCDTVTALYWVTVEMIKTAPDMRYDDSKRTEADYW